MSSNALSSHLHTPRLLSASAKPSPTRSSIFFLAWTYLPGFLTVIACVQVVDVFLREWCGDPPGSAGRPPIALCSPLYANAYDWPGAPTPSFAKGQPPEVRDGCSSACTSLVRRVFYCMHQICKRGIFFACTSMVRGVYCPRARRTSKHCSLVWLLSSWILMMHLFFLTYLLFNHPNVHQDPPLPPPSHSSFF